MSLWTFAGTKAERGLVAWEKEMSLKQSESNENEPTSSTFDFPFGMDALRRYCILNYALFSLTTKILYYFSCKWTSYMPFLPTYKQR